MDEIHEGDKVYITMSKNDIKKGIVIHIMDYEAFNYEVELEERLHGFERVRIFCSREYLTLQ